MAVTIEELGIDRLSVRERLDLIEQIWDSLPEAVPVANKASLGGQSPPRPAANE